MKTLSRWWPMGLIPVFLGLFYLWTGAIGQNAVLKQQIKARDKTIAVLAIQKAKVDTIHAKAVAVYLPTKTRWDSVKVTLGEPVAIIALADTTIKACEAVALSCEMRVSIRDSIIGQQELQIHDLKKPKPFLIRIGKPVLPFLGGIITGMILTK